MVHWPDEDSHGTVEHNLSRPREPVQHKTTTAIQTKGFTPCPEEFCKLVWFKGGSSHKLYEPVYRAFHARGYSVTRNVSRAHFLWMDQPNDPEGFYETLQTWQRYNQLPNTDKWDDKDEMALRMNNYYSEKGVPHLHSFPESYVLHLPDGLESFRKRLLDENGGMDVPWVLKEPTVNQGKGIVILPPQSDELKGIVNVVRDLTSTEGKDRKEEEDEESSGKDRLVVQRYICDEMTYGGRKFDVRVFWAVASVDPLIVLYHTEQNYVRIGHASYDEASLGNSTTKAHLTTHTFGSTETKATWDEFREFIERHVFGSDASHVDRFRIDKNTPSGIRDTLRAIRSDPFLHVQNQMKTVIGHLADAYKDITFHGNSMVAENGFTWHAADMIVDNNLDVFIIEGTDGPGKDEDYDFRIKMHGELLGNLVDTVEEIVSQQAEHGVIDLPAIKEKGVLGGYEVVYNDGWFTDYRYRRLPPKDCMRSRGGGNSAKPPDGGGSREANPLSLARAVVPATFTALPRNHPATAASDRAKTFWMKSRTRRTSEPVARSLRRNGWTPVDAPDAAQLVYRADEEFGSYDDDDAFRPWQWVSQFPSQYPFFDDGDHERYLDIGDGDGDTGGVCRPIVHRDRPLEVLVYWLVLGLDPLIVLFHDGFLWFEYSEDDENEFLDLSGPDGGTERVWKGSWRAFEHHVRETHGATVRFGTSRAAVAAASISLDPVSHVRNQMKSSVVKLARGFHKHAMERRAGEPDAFSSFALFFAQFQIDRNLNVFATDAGHSFVKGEDHAEVVSLHDDLYGSAFRLIEYLNGTSAGEAHGELREEEEVLGRYEWLIRPDGGAKPWKFRYDWNYKAKECFE
eukprot:CAMPEP_0197181724 /NCGR_PEP_ID=MMETSP1423-20130617/5916_1 /TAXON_ID=476441 /ORGANISM="Pseudo-nitzschia heimii, Strain UNC1101" /LENGTH=851 /DNA_ID=CAMNT_0042632027 /DNA_START=349 /DNA_END=2904 /DNA_ORIENTATION=+